jgi:hypothetical protein
VIKAKEAIDRSRDQLGSAARAEKIGIAGVGDTATMIVSITNAIMTPERKRVTIARLGTKEKREEKNQNNISSKRNVELMTRMISIIAKSMKRDSRNQEEKNSVTIALMSALMKEEILKMTGESLKTTVEIQSMKGGPLKMKEET